MRSRFTKPRTSRYGDGTQRLPDTDKGSRLSTVGSRGVNDVYVGGAQKHKSWYNNAVLASKNDEERSDGSQEDMVPMGQIAVRHDMTWEERDALPPSTPA